MRRTLMTLSLFMTAAAWGLAQQPPPAGNVDPKEERRDLVLKYWEQSMAQIQSLEAECERTTKDKVFKTDEIYRGRARFMKSGPGQPSRASLEMVKADNPQVFEKLLLSGTFLYEFAPSTKEIRVHELPQPKAGENVEHNLLALLFGMKAEEAKKRYLIQLEHEDANYFYLKIIPQLERDKADFAQARLALVRQTYLPRTLWFLQANGNEVKWDLPRVQNPANLKATDFQPPATPPAGWKISRVPVQTPTKVRSAGG